MQSVIVYRNPVEAAIWESLMSSSATFPVLCGIASFFAVFITLASFLQRRGGIHGSSKSTNFSLAVAAVVGITVVRLMLI